MAEAQTRDVLFISKATPGDDDFVLWLAPRLEAAGYTVFADICSLEPADRWRRQIARKVGDVLTMGSAQNAERQPLKFYI